MKLLTDYLRPPQKKDFKVVAPSPSLFGEPTAKEIYTALSKKLCPHCGHKLYLNLKRTIYRCKSVKHKGFIVTQKTMRRYVEN